MKLNYMKISYTATEREALSALIGQIYDTTLMPHQWPHVLGKISAFLGTRGASIFAQDTQAQDGQVFHNWGTPAEYIKSYFETYAPLDPTRLSQFCFDAGEPFATADCMPYDEFRESRFYLEWAKPQQLADHLAVILKKSPTEVSLFGTFRGDEAGIVDGQALDQFNLIWPHVQRAVLIGKILDERKNRTQELVSTIDALSAAIFLIDGKGRVVHANGAGLALAGGQGVIQIARGRLVLKDAEFSRMLLDVASAKLLGDQALGTKAIARILTDQDGERFTAHVLPLAAGERERASWPSTATTALFLQRATADFQSPAELIAHAFRLTPTELRVLLGIVEIGGTPQVAQAMGIAETTVKTHLGRVYSKTGTARQTDLAKLVASYSSGLLS